MKEDTLRFEREFLSPYATKSEDTRGRETPIKPCPLRTEFQRDREQNVNREDELIKSDTLAADRSRQPNLENNACKPQNERNSG